MGVRIAPGIQWAQLVFLLWNASVCLKQRENSVSNKENRDAEGAFNTIDTRRATEGTRWDGSTSD